MVALDSAKKGASISSILQSIFTYFVGVSLNFMLDQDSRALI